MTPERVRVAASWLGVTRDELTVRVTSAPFWAAKACRNGALTAAKSAVPKVAEAVETSRTTPITIACTL